MARRSPTAVGVILRIAGVGVLAASAATLHAQIPGNNVNMVSGTTWPDGDPFLQRQNEPSIAASTRNPLHLLAGANDYRTVDVPFADDGGETTGDAWLGLFKSIDGGQRWTSTLLPGYPQDQSAAGLASPLKGYAAGADPVVRAGTNGLFYYSGIVFDRAQTITHPDGTTETRHGKSAIVLSRFIDNNNQEAGDPIKFLGTTIVTKSGPNGSDNNVPFLDKPWLAVDIPRGARPPTCTIRTTRTVRRGGVTVEEAFDQKIAAGAVYLAYSSITGTGTPHVRSTILLQRSMDCGATFGAPIQVSRPQDAANQGATIAIDPLSGHVWVAWRRISTDASTSNAIMLAKMTFGGHRFNTPGVARQLIARSHKARELMRFFEHHNARKRGQSKAEFEAETSEVEPEVSEFDQGTSIFSFRTRAYPTMAVDTLGRVYIAWSERGFAQRRPDPVSGDARVVLTTTADGRTFTPPLTVEDAQDGHQLMPSLALAGGRLLVAFYDLRETRAATFNRHVSDQITVTGLRHTIDIRAALGTTGATPAFKPSVQVSRYLTGYTPSYLQNPNAPRDESGRILPQQLQINPPNLPMFQLGTVPFLGDYIDVAPAPAFVPLGKDQWFYNTLPSAAPPTFHVVWTDNRDVRPPRDGNWTNYTAPRPAGASVLDPAILVDQCLPGNAGSRNQNIYTATVTAGLIAGSPGNTKPLSPKVPRAFVVFAQNTSADPKVFRMRITAQPRGGRASFDQFSLLTTIDVSVSPRATASRTVYATSTDPKAIINVDVVELSAVGGVEVDGGLTSQVILNPDIQNPDIENPDIQNPDIQNPDIQNVEIYNPDIQNPDIENPDIQNPDIQNPDIQNPDIQNIIVANPDIENPDIQNPDIQNPDIENPDIQNPDIQNPNLADGAIVDATWKVTNTGNTTTAFNVNLFLAQTQLPLGTQAQLLLYKVYRTPVTTPNGCELRYETRNIVLANVADPHFITPAAGALPDQNDPSEKNAVIWLSPGDTGRITLRLLVDDKRVLVPAVNHKGEIVYLHPELDPRQDVIPAVSSQAVDVQDPPGSPEPPLVTPGGSNLFFVQQPSGAAAGQPIAPAVRVQVRDNTGAAIANVPVTLTLVNGGPASLAGNAAVTDGSGGASFPQLAVSADGRDYQLRAEGARNRAVDPLQHRQPGARGGGRRCRDAR